MTCDEDFYGSILSEYVSASRICGFVSFTTFIKFSAIISSNTFFSFSLHSFWNYSANLSTLDIVPVVSQNIIIKNFFFCSAWIISSTQSSSSMIDSSVSANLLLIPSSVFFFKLLCSSALFGSSLYFLFFG